MIPKKFLISILCLMAASSSLYPAAGPSYQLSAGSEALETAGISVVLSLFTRKTAKQTIARAAGSAAARVALRYISAFERARRAITRGDKKTIVAILNQEQKYHASKDFQETFQETLMPLLFYAIEANKMGIVICLVEEFKANVSQLPYCLLACHSNPDTKIAEYLLNHGAPLSLLNSNNRAALAMNTIEDNKPEHLKLYIAAGAEINREKNLLSPLDQAIDLERVYKAKLLRESSEETIALLQGKLADRQKIIQTQEKLADCQKIIQILKDAGAQRNFPGTMEQIAITSRL